MCGYFDCCSSHTSISSCVDGSPLIWLLQVPIPARSFPFPVGASPPCRDLSDSCFRLLSAGGESLNPTTVIRFYLPHGLGSGVRVQTGTRGSHRFVWWLIGIPWWRLHICSKGSGANDFNSLLLFYQHNSGTFTLRPGHAAKLLSMAVVMQQCYPRGV